MKLITKYLPDDHSLLLAGDTHEGTVLQYRDGINEFKEYLMAKRDRFAVHMGDEIEAIMVDDKRYDPETVASVPLEQMKNVIADFGPVRKRMLTWLLGNHPRKLWRFGNITKMICQELEIEYGTVSCRLTIRSKTTDKILYKCFLHHGFGSIRSHAKDPVQALANMKANLKLKLYKKAGDCVIQAMGHCFSEDTEICTRSGWKKYDELQPNEEVLTFNTETGVAEWQPIEREYIFRNAYSTMIECKNRFVNFCITPEHRVVYKKIQRDGSFNWGEAKAETIRSHHKISIPMAGKSGQSDYDISNDWISLIGWLVSEGHFRRNGAVQLFQQWSNKDAIESILQRLGIQYSIYRMKSAGREFKDPKGNYYKTKEDCATFYITVAESKQILQHIQSKEIPQIAFKFSDRQFKILLNALIAGDGIWQSSQKSCIYYSKDKETIDILQILAISHGWRTSSVWRSRAWELRMTNRSTVWIQGIDRKFPDNRWSITNAWKDVQATKTVWCVTVGNGTVFTRRNGRAVVLGNTHKLLVQEPIPALVLTDDGKKIHQHYTKPGKGLFIHPDHRWYVNTGSFLKLYQEGVDGYGDMYGFDPIELGFIVVKVRDGEVVAVDPVVL